MKLERIDHYKIHSYDTDLKGNLSLPVLTRFLQETAWLNSEEMQIGYKELVKKDMAWVLFKQYIKMDSWPLWGDTLTIKTWPSQADKLFCFREFELFVDDKLIGQVSTSWLVINTKTRRPVRTSKYYNEFFDNSQPMLFPEIIKTKMISESDAQISHIQAVHMFDIDINNHVNNSLYPQWCLNGYNIDFYRNNTLVEIEQQFIAEARFGDEISILTNQIDDSNFQHRIVRDGKDIFLLRLRWEKSIKL